MKESHLLLLWQTWFSKFLYKSYLWFDPLASEIVGIIVLDCPACGPSPVAQVKNPLANAGDESSISGSGRSARKGKWLPTPASYLGNLLDGGAWQATVYRVTKESYTTYRLNNNHQHVQPKKWGLHGVKSFRRRYSRYDLPFWDCSIKPANHVFHHSEHPLKKK